MDAPPSKKRTICNSQLQMVRFFFYCTPCDCSVSNFGFLRKYEKNWPLSWWLVNAVSFCAVHGANLPVSLSNAVRKLCGVMAPALPAALSCRFLRGHGYRLCRASESKLNGAVNAGSMSLLLPPTPIGAIRRLSRANLFGKCCVEGRARSSHISVLSSISVGLSPYIGEQPCAKVKERAGTDLPLRRTAMLFRCRFSFPNSISISKQQCQVNAKVFESGEPYCPAPPSIALCLENWVRRDTVF